MAHPGPPQERGSVRPVTIEGDADARTYYCEVRSMPTSGLQPNDIVWVELGATFAIVSGRKEKVGGQWRQAIVLPSGNFGSGVHVRLSPDPKTAPAERG